jgi:hypothetical protein
MTDDISFVCPRCHTEVTERLWGPCRGCRHELVATLGGRGPGMVGPDAAPARFEPAMHVVPNHVATKD